MLVLLCCFSVTSRVFSARHPPPSKPKLGSFFLRFSKPLTRSRRSSLIDGCRRLWHSHYQLLLVVCQSKQGGDYLLLASVVAVNVVTPAPNDASATDSYLTVTPQSTWSLLPFEEAKWEGNLPVRPACMAGFGLVRQRMVLVCCFTVHTKYAWELSKSSGLSSMSLTLISTLERPR
jgi:hypothetical protein